MKSHMLLLREVLNDLGTRCCTSTSSDWKTITTRVEHEGLSFLTITLPSFCDGLQKALSVGKVDPSMFPGFSPSKHSRLPAFLQGWMGLVFDSSTGRLLDEPSIDAIYSIRQLTLLFGKVGLSCSDERVRHAIDQYLECEYQVHKNDHSLDPIERSDFRKMAILIWEDVIRIVDRDIYEGHTIPKHGPGATADKLRGNAKFNQTRWPKRLEYYFPHGEFLYPSWSHFCDSPDVDLVEPGAELPVKVITVPKTLKTPRIIAIEPTAMQYVQQGILESLVRAIEGHDYLSKLVGFSDQVPNQEMAREGSLSGKLATLDLSEASDRVSNQLVQELGAYYPHFRDGLDATRSRKADVPGHGVIHLTKYASMGSALCFPVEAMVFLVIVCLGIQYELNRPLTKEDIQLLVGQVRIYGDDIIVPVEYVRSVITKLETFGFKVNGNKSFWTGKFRESCGKEYYNGEDVSVVRVRAMLPTSLMHVREIISTSSLRNLMYTAGNWGCAGFLDSWMERVLSHYPTVSEQSPGLGRHSHLGYVSQDRMCKFLHTPLVRAYVVNAVIPTDHLEGSGALLKVFLNRSMQPIADRKHLERAGRPKSVNIKLRWVPAY